MPVDLAEFVVQGADVLAQTLGLGDQVGPEEPTLLELGAFGARAGERFLGCRA
ncbi:hypothetical protein [Nocardia gipuzkoensis]